MSERRTEGPDAQLGNLPLAGYDEVLSIEHEDSILSGREGFLKVVVFLKEVILSEPRSAMWWA